MKTEVKLITPELAKEMLNKNGINRPLRDCIVNEYARLMKANLWQEKTGETIKISSDGILLDGQHRLRAIIKANIDLPFLIAKDCDKEIFKVIDTGLRRSASDVLSIIGVDNSGKISAGIRKYLTLKAKNFGSVGGLGKSTQSFGSQHKGLPTSNYEILSIYSNKPKYWDGACNNAKKWYRSSNLLSCSDYMGYFVFLSEINSDQAFEFFDKLSSGDNLSSKNSIKLLREKFIFFRLSSKLNLSGLAKSAYIFKAWNQFRKGNELKSLRWNNDDLFPMPI